MTDETTGTDKATPYPTPWAWFESWLQLWTLPAAIGARLLDRQVAGWPAHTPHHPRDGQLVVPEPIENDGEHALLA